MSLSSIYYHFVEARRRTPDGKDDFTAWLLNFENQTSAVVEALDTIDFYFLTLPELKQTLVETVEQTVAQEPAREPSA